MPGRAERVSNKMAKSVVLLDGVGGESNGNSTPNASGNGNCGEMFDVILYFGIIDILQDYDISKKLEHAYKSLQVDLTSISAVDPKLYSKRFRDFIHTIFFQDTTMDS